ncbi:hypothetical protein PV325_002267 [Microctonus aethiopoides]|nr:hypothetical protein PV325_002267 [Microctonus aethiopoides]
MGGIPSKRAKDQSATTFSRTQGGSANCDEDVVKKRSENSTAPKYFIDSNAMSNFERDRLGHRGPGDEISTGLVKGLDHIRNPQLNKFSYIELLENEYPWPPQQRYPTNLL